MTVQLLSMASVMQPATYLQTILQSLCNALLEMHFTQILAVVSMCLPSGVGLLRKNHLGLSYCSDGLYPTWAETHLAIPEQTALDRRRSSATVDIGLCNVLTC